MLNKQKVNSYIVDKLL